MSAEADWSMQRTLFRMLVAVNDNIPSGRQNASGRKIKARNIPELVPQANSIEQNRAGRNVSNFHPIRRAAGLIGQSCKVVRYSFRNLDRSSHARHSELKSVTCFSR